MARTSTKIIALGVGDMAASPELGNTNLVIECWRNDRVHRLLFDCGFTCGFKLKKAGLTVYELDEIVISHTHPDHVAGLASLALERYFGRRGGIRPVLHLLPGLEGVLWSSFLEEQLSTLPNKRATLEDFFVPSLASRSDKLSLLDGVAVMEFVPVIHNTNNEEVKPCFGFRLQTDSEVRVFYTCDTVFMPGRLEEHYQWADVIIHDCQTTDGLGYVHPHIEDLERLPVEIRRKMWLIHYGDNFSSFEAYAREKGFLGFMYPGQVLDLDCPGKSYALPHDTLSVEHR